MAVTTVKLFYDTEWWYYCGVVVNKSFITLVPRYIWLGLQCLSETNTPAYHTQAWITAQKSFIKFVTEVKRQGQENGESQRWSGPNKLECFLGNCDKFY
jgi:K+-transporting ATPase A subunit